MSDDALIGPDPRSHLEAIRAGSVEAFRALVDQHREPLLRVADRILGDPQLAEDAVQEAFLLVFRKIHAFREEAALGSWIMRIAINESLRLRSRRPKAGDSEQSLAELAILDQEADQTPEKNEALGALDVAIDHLPMQQRLVFCLIQVEGMGREAAAAALDLTEGTVRFHLHAARKNLSRQLSQFLMTESEGLAK